MTFARRSPRRFSTRSLVVLASAAVVGSLLAVTQAPSASAAVRASATAQACAAPLSGKTNLTGNPADAALQPLHVQCAWVQTVPGQIGQASGVAYTANGVQSVAEGDKSGSVWGFNVTNGDRTLAYNSGGVRIDGPLSVSTTGSTLYIPHTASKKSPELLAVSTTSGKRTAYGHICSVALCQQLGGLSLANGFVYTGGGHAQSVYGVKAGSLSGGWSYLNSDSTNSTPATADLYGSGQSEAIFTDDQTPNKKDDALGGGHLRIFSASGKQVCNANIGSLSTSPHLGSFDSSPAVATFGSTSSPTIVFGTGESLYQPNRLMAFNSSCQKLWISPKLSSATIGAPTIADVNGDGVPDIIETTFPKSSAATVYVINGANGTIESYTALTLGVLNGTDAEGRPHEVRKASSCVGAAGTSSQASVFTLDGKQYIVAPAGECGAVLLQMSGSSLVNLGQLASPGAACASQNTPVITVDDATHIGITLGGYWRNSNGVSGCVVHFTIPSTTASASAPVTLGALDWPEFHHDGQLTGTQAATLPAGHRDTAITGQTLKPGQALYSPNGAWELGWLPNSTTLALISTKDGAPHKTWAGVSSLTLTKTGLKKNGIHTIFNYVNGIKLNPKLHQRIPLNVATVYLTVTNAGKVLLTSPHSDRWWPDNPLYNLVTGKALPVRMT